jgi:hypothetical protein
VDVLKLDVVGTLVVSVVGRVVAGGFVEVTIAG